MGVVSTLYDPLGAPYEPLPPKGASEGEDIEISTVAK